VFPAGSPPGLVERHVVANIVDEDGATLLRDIGELIVVRDVLIGPTSLQATHRVIPAPPKRRSQSRVDVFVREEPDR
jgi:hypothetical protein